MIAGLVGESSRWLGKLLCYLLCAGAVLPGLTFAAELPWTHQGEQRFVLQRADDPLVLGVAVYRWRHDGQRYELRSTTEAKGLLAVVNPTKTIQESHGSLVAGNFRPDSFTHEKKRRTERASFDWASGSLSYRDQTVSLPANAQDLLSVYAQLAAHPPRKGALELPVSTGTKLAVYRFEWEGDETLQINGVRFKTVHVHVVLDNERLDFWLPAESKVAKATAGDSPMGDIVWPVRIRMTDKNGTVIEQSVDVNGSPH